MVFTSFTFGWFLLAVFAAYWLLRERRRQNALLLVVSYVFYGWVHPWFCALIALSTVVDYVAALAMAAQPHRRRRWLVASLVGTACLLLLAACEALHAECAALARVLVRRCQGITVLATSRESFFGVLLRWE